METVNPTRMNLLLKREEVKIAGTGAGLLRNKRDVLLVEFFSVMRALVALREMLEAKSNEATLNLAFSLGLEGREKLNSFSFIRPKPPVFKIINKNLLGLKIPEVIVEPSIDKERQMSAGFESGLVIKETQEAFRGFLNLILRILPQELKLKRLGSEIKSTTRKVNSLEKFVIPHLYSQIKFIRETLEEREREDIFRLKRLKKHFLT